MCSEGHMLPETVSPRLHGRVLRSDSGGALLLKVF